MLPCLSPLRERRRPQHILFLTPSSNPNLDPNLNPNPNCVKGDVLAIVQLGFDGRWITLNLSVFEPNRTDSNRFRGVSATESNVVGETTGESVELSASESSRMAIAKSPSSQSLVLHSFAGLQAQLINSTGQGTGQIIRHRSNHNAQVKS